MKHFPRSIEELEERIAPSGMGDTADNNNPGENNTNLAGNRKDVHRPGLRLTHERRLRHEEVPARYRRTRRANCP